LSAAEKDSSVSVSYEEVDKNLSERIDYFVSQLGSVEALEKEMGLSLGEIKAQHFEEVREELLVNSFKAVLFGGVYVSRDEVVDYYNTFFDSIPSSPATASFSLIQKPVVLSESSLSVFLSSFNSLKDSLVAGQLNFSEVAFSFSEDPSVSQNSGFMTTNRGDLVSEYEKTAYKLAVGEIGGPVKTEYGYHLIKLIDRVGEKITSQHILKTIKPSLDDFSLARASVDSLVVFCKNDPGLFDSLSYNFRLDKNNLSGVYEGVSLVGFPSFVVEKIKKMGDFSMSDVFVEDYNLYVLYKYSYFPEEKSTLENNWKEIEFSALNNKIEKLFNAWVEEKYNEVYVKINPIY